MQTAKKWTILLKLAWKYSYTCHSHWRYIPFHKMLEIFLFNLENNDVAHDLKLILRKINRKLVKKCTLPHETKIIVEVGRAEKKRYMEPFTFFEQNILNISIYFRFPLKNYTIIIFSLYLLVSIVRIVRLILHSCYLGWYFFSLHIDSSVSKDTCLNKIKPSWLLASSTIKIQGEIINSNKTNRIKLKYENE